MSLTTLVITCLIISVILTAISVGTIIFLFLVITKLKSHLLYLEEKLAELGEHHNQLVIDLNQLMSTPNAELN